MYTNNEEQLSAMKNFISDSFSIPNNFTTKKIDVASNYTWGELKDSGIEPYAAMPGLAPYNIDNKHKKSALYWNTTGIWLRDGKFYDSYGNDLNRYVDPLNGKILYGDGDWNREYIRNTRVYVQDEKTGKEEYTGMFFDVSNPAKVMNTYYKLLDDGVFSGFYLSNDDYNIYDSNFNNTNFKLIEEETLVNGIQMNVWKVCDVATNVKYEWHVNIETRQFIRDGIGVSINPTTIKIPFSETTYIGKKAFLMKTLKNSDGTVEYVASKYYVNKYGDIIDPAGNVILSKKDRYKVSDSNMIGFSEVHNASKKLSTYDATNILQREWSFMKDEHIPDKWGRSETNSFDEYQKVTDPRYKLDHYSFDIGNPVREYTGSDEIRFLSNDELSKIKQENGMMKIPLFVLESDSEKSLIGDVENASGTLMIKTFFPVNYSLGDVFKNIKIRYENKIPNYELNPKWDIYIDWVANNDNKSFFNLNDLENPIHFIKKGRIEPRTLHWTGNPIYITPKVYDGTTKVYTKGDE